MHEAKGSELRKVVLDTETTGLQYARGDRVIEIGCVELLGRKLSGQRFHRYLNPEREIEAGAQAVHGISNEFLLDKPKFREVADEFIDFIAGAELVIHNAAFDVGFLDHEFSLIDRALIADVCGAVTDTLKMAKELHPGRRNSLDALCERYGVSNAHRTLHGALLDAELLAEVYLAMTRGQDSLIAELEPAPAAVVPLAGLAQRPALKVLRASEDELAQHRRVLAEIDKQSKGNCIWSALEAG